MPRQHADELIGGQRIDIALQFFDILQAYLALPLRKFGQDLTNPLNAIRCPFISHLVLVVFGEGAIISSGKPSFHRIESARQLLQRYEARPFMAAIDSHYGKQAGPGANRS